MIVRFLEDYIISDSKSWSMDRMEVDHASKCREKRINLKFVRDCNNQNWLVSEKCGKNTLSTVPKPVPKPKPSLKVSLPITHYLKNMQQYMNSNVRMKTPSPNQTETRPQQFGLPPSTPLLSSPSSLRKFRHPIPTSKGRTKLADKLDQIIKTPEPISNNTNLKCNPAMPQSNINTPPIEERVKHKAEELNTSERKCNIFMKHNLLTLVAPKGSYGKRSNNPVNKENLRTTNNTQTTVVQTTQTEKAFVVTEEDYQILETIKNNGLTSQDLQNQIVNLKKQMDKNNDNDGLVIDLESIEEINPSNDILDTVMKYSLNNKNVLNKQVMVTTKDHQLSAPAALPPPECTASTSDQHPHLEGPVPPATSETPSLSRNPVPNANMVNFIFALATFKVLQKLQTNNGLEWPQTHMLPRTDSQTTQTETDDEDNNSKKRKRHAQEVPVLMPQQQEVFQPQMQPPQLRQMQIQQFVPEHVERTTQLFPSNLPGLIPHQRNQFTMTRNHTQYPFEYDTSSALSTPQIQVQMPSLVQLPSAPRLHPRDPRSHAMQSQLRPPHMSRVLSTQEANLHSQAAQHHNCNWSFPQYFDRHGNVFPQRHQ